MTRPVLDIFIQLDIRFFKILDFKLYLSKCKKYSCSCNTMMCLQSNCMYVAIAKLKVDCHVQLIHSIGTCSYRQEVLQNIFFSDKH